MAIVRLFIISFCTLLFSGVYTYAQKVEPKHKLNTVVKKVDIPSSITLKSFDFNKGRSVRSIIENGDTFPLYALRDIYVYPPLEFKNKRQEKFYWRTVHDVKRVLPLAKYIKGIIQETNDTLITMSSDKERRKYMKGFEVKLYKREYDRMTKLTLNQGKLLIRLVSREMEMSSFDLIKAYRGGFRAGFYQFFASFFGANLKWEYGTRDEDAIIERVINLVESGQL